MTFGDEDSRAIEARDEALAQAMAPWTPDQALRADARDADMIARHNWIVRDRTDKEMWRSASPLGTVAREFAAACVAEAMRQTREAMGYAERVGDLTPKLIGAIHREKVRHWQVECEESEATEARLAAAETALAAARADTKHVDDMLRQAEREVAHMRSALENISQLGGVAADFAMQALEEPAALAARPEVSNGE